jgi:hypothetical protein
MTNSLNLPKNVPNGTTFSQFGVTYTYNSANDVWAANIPPTIDDMVDVDITTIAPTANQILSWDVSTNNFIPSDGFDARLSASTTDDVSEASNLYFTTARARNSISVSGDLSYNSATGVTSFTERTDSEVRGLISVSGDLSYNSTTGVISYTDTDIDAYTKSEVDNAINTIELTPGPQGDPGPAGPNRRKWRNRKYWATRSNRTPKGQQDHKGQQAQVEVHLQHLALLEPYAFLVKNGSGFASGASVSGSSLQSGGVSAAMSLASNNTSYSANMSQLSRGDTTMSGTWRAMGSVTYSNASTFGRGTVFLRIS